MKKILIYYFIFLLSFFSIFSAGVMDSIDGLQYLAVARNIYYTGEPTAPVYEYAERKNLHLSSFVASNGKTYSMTGFGYSLAFLPAVFTTDMVYKLYSVSPPIHFPLESDWLILFTASFTNTFFGAGLGLIMFIYFQLLGLNKKQSLLLSFISIIGTNLFVYTKHSFAHMSFIFLMMLTFLFIKFYTINKKNRFLILAGISFGALSIVYNQTFLLTTIPFLAYYLLLTKPNLKKDYKKVLKNSLFGLIGILPFLIIYFWYENLRSLPEQNFAGSQFYVNYAKHTFSFPITVFIEGLHGQLFSIGRSIFIYSPLLLIPILFWMRIKKIYRPEVITYWLLFWIYIIFYAAQYRIGAPDQGIIANWHGESSWGPRYIAPLIPMGMLLVGVIYQTFSKKLKLFIFYPLFIIGLLIQLLGILMPYQIKLHEMDHKIFLNGTEYYSSSYSNFLPRYNPILNMAKKLNKLRQNLPRYIDNGPYNLRFYDGVDFSFPVGTERWRVIEGKGHISFDNSKREPVKEITIGLINHPTEVSSQSAQIKFTLNDQNLPGKPILLTIGQRELIKIPIPQNYLKAKENGLLIEVGYATPVEIKFPLNQEVIVGRKQILGLISFDINSTRQNLESIDVPFVSPLGPAMTGLEYKNWGGENKHSLRSDDLKQSFSSNKDPWKAWDIHTQTFERLPDLWWVRNLFYWDIPKSWIVGLFIINIAVLGFSAFRLTHLVKKES